MFALASRKAWRSMMDFTSGTACYPMLEDCRMLLMMCESDQMKISIC